MTHEIMKKNIFDGLYNRSQGFLFFEDLISLYGLSPEDPAVPKMYSLAWKMGHSFGYREVYSIFNDLVHIFRSSSEVKNA